MLDTGPRGCQRLPLMAWLYLVFGGAHLLDGECSDHVVLLAQLLLVRVRRRHVGMRRIGRLNDDEEVRELGVTLE